MHRNSPIIQLEMSKNIYNIDNYNVVSVTGDHNCKNQSQEMYYEACLTFTRDYVKTHADLSCTIDYIYSKMLDYGILTLGSKYIIRNWPNPTIIKNYIKRARQQLREPFPDILPDSIGKENERSNYSFSNEMLFFEEEQILFTLENNSQIVICDTNLLIYLTGGHNCRIQADGTGWNMCKGVYSQVFIIIATVEVGDKFLDAPGKGHKCAV